jgi:hypothetical protein
MGQTHQAESDQRPLSSIRIATALAGVAVLMGASTAPAIRSCRVSFHEGPLYYALDLVGTKNVPGMGLATGRAEVSLSPTSPFSVLLAEDGSYRYDVSVKLERLRPPRSGVLVAWVTTTDLGEVQRLGVLDGNLQIGGTTSWNRFLVVISLEADDDPLAERWTGPIAFRGMSRSGMMHTMAGHGAFQQENCAAYGYDE